MAFGSQSQVLGYNMAHHFRHIITSQFLHRLLLIVFLYMLSQSADNFLRYTEPTQILYQLRTIRAKAAI